LAFAQELAISDGSIALKGAFGDECRRRDSLRPYSFAMVDHKLLIVDPSNKAIADVLSK
jgi:hypothetical protein